MQNNLPRLHITPISQSSVNLYRPAETLTQEEQEPSSEKGNLLAKTKRAASGAADFSRRLLHRESGSQSRNRKKTSSGSRRTHYVKNHQQNDEKTPLIGTLKGQVAICAGVVLLALAIKAIDAPAAQTVSVEVKDAITSEVDVDRNIGKLQYVENVFSDTVSVWWQQRAPETLQPPFDGRVTQKYSLSCPGIEIFGKKQDVLACCDGKVASVEENNGEYTVTVSHTGGLKTVYGRLLTATVEKGDKVKAGVSIGAAVPNKDGYSMFLQVKLDDVIVDPLPYFQ